MFSTENTLFIEWTGMPKPIREHVLSRYESISNNIYLEVYSELGPHAEAETWETTLTTTELHNYWKDQCDTNNFVGDINDFIKEYGLTFEAWLIGQNVNLKGITKILIHVSW